MNNISDKDLLDLKSENRYLKFELDRANRRIDYIDHPIGPCTARYNRLVETQASKQFSELWENRYGH